MSKCLLLSASILAACIAWSPHAMAQQIIKVCVPDSNGGCQNVDSSNPFPTSASATVTVAPLTSTNLGGTIAVSNTFQSIQVSTAGRKGCLIQNQSTTDPMWVFFGPIGSATKATSFELDTNHGLAISCAVGGLGVVTDQISITGTASDAYNANFQ